MPRNITPSIVRHVNRNGPSISHGVTSRRGTPGPTHDEICLRAFQIYEARGCVPGHEIEDWTQAERELGYNN